ncbi:MAG: AAA family ATPase [Lachnospiraceae bacterium]
MGVYLNPGNGNFKTACRSKIYIDKTGLIEETNQMINTQQRFVCVSRPRRFGKSMAAYMLAAYYGKGMNSSDLFAPYKVAQYEDYKQHLNQYHVIFLNAQKALSRSDTVEKMLKYIQGEILEELRVAFPKEIPEKETILSAALEKLYSKTQEKFIFIIDEWDCVFREKTVKAEEYIPYLDFLRDLFKDQEYVALAYMTGILPIKKYGTHSALNMFDEYSMTDPGECAEFIGFTEQEVKELCKRYVVDFDRMKSWYDGYTFSENLHIYNPKSVVDSIRRKRFSSYWTQTETYEALKFYLDMNYDGLKNAIVEMLAGESVKINTEKFQNDMTTFSGKDDVLTLLVHLGYLAFDAKNSTVFIPNMEIRGEFCNAIEGEKWNDVIKALEKSDRLLEATWNQDTDTVATILDEAHSEHTSILTYNDENSLSCVIALAYFNAQKEYTQLREFPSGKGFADIVYLPKKYSEKPALVIELKYDKSAKGALAQIKEKRYPEKLKEYHGNLLLVGINYDKETKKHTCEIELMIRA